MRARSTSTALPRSLQPIVQPIDDWGRNWKLALVFECRVGTGRLMVCSADITNDLGTRPVARQLRHSLLDYMAGPKFLPKTTIAVEVMRGLWFDSRIMHHLGATAKADGANAAAVIDGDPNTFWSVGIPPARAAATAAPVPAGPRELTISFPQPVAMDGVTLMTRQNERNHQGDIRGYTISISDDGSIWHEVSKGELESTFEPQTVRFSQTVTARQLKLTAYSGFGNDSTTALAELAVLYAGPKLAVADEGPVDYQRVRSTTGDVIESGPATVPARPPATSGK